MGNNLRLILTVLGLAQKKYDPGASDTEIRIGNIMPYSGAISSYSTIGKTEAAYFNKINAEGGINGRKIKFISYDDGSNPAKTVGQARKLVEGDEVLLIFQSLGGTMNIAIEKYLNDRKVPQLFVAAPNKRFGDPKNFRWTMGWQPTAENEGRIYAQYLLKNHPNIRIGVLYVNVDVGKEYLAGLKNGLEGETASHCGSPFRSDRSDGRFTGCHPQEFRCRRYLLGSSAEGRRPSYPQDG
jgi:branched-chain amino acid transport system substrate-binding protein